MIIDSMVFNNELDVLDLRLHILDPVVDKFVIVEASKTQTLKDKPFYFDLNKDRYAQFSDKIIHVKVENCPTEGGWTMEHYQRNCITTGLKHIQNLSLSDIVAISDVDEIWNPAFARYLPTILTEDDPIATAKMSFLPFYLNMEAVGKEWMGTVFCEVNTLVEFAPQELRDRKDLSLPLTPGGWHFCYQGGVEAVYQKFFDCIEPLDKSVIPLFDKFKADFDRKIKHNGSFIYSDKEDDSLKLQGLESIKVLPEYLQKNLDKYSNMLYGFTSA